MILDVVGGRSQLCGALAGMTMRVDSALMLYPNNHVSHSTTALSHLIVRGQHCHREEGALRLTRRCER